MNHRNSNYKLNRYSNNNNNNNSQYPVYRQDNQNRGGGERGNYNQGGSSSGNNNPNPNNNQGGYYSNQQGGSSSSNYQNTGGHQGTYGGSSDAYQNSDRRGGDNRRGGGGYQNKDRYSSGGGNYHGGHGGSGNSNHGSGNYQNNYNQGGYNGNNHSGGSSRGGYHNNDNRRQNNNNNNQRSSGGGKMSRDRNYDRRRQERGDNRSANHYSGGHHGGSHHGGHRNNSGHHGHHNNHHSSNNQVQNFYNNNKGYNQQERKNLETFHIRVFHNWVKSVLIQKYGEIQRSIVKAENANTKLPENYLYILDLACGKGGDHKKWLMHSHACFYIGVDIAMDALNQAYNRAVITLNEIKHNSRHHSNIKFGFFEKDCSCNSEDFWKNIIAPPVNQLPSSENPNQQEGDKKDNYENKIELENEENKDDLINPTPNKEGDEKEGGKDKELNSNYMFDVVSCQMALHYMHESEQSARNFLDNCTQKMNDQGFLLLTFTDGNAVLDIIRSKGAPTSEGGTLYSSKHFSIKFDTPVDQIDLNNRPYGNKYGFYLQESVGSQVDGVIKYIPEYLVNVQRFIDIAREYSLEVRENSLLPDFYENNKNSFGDLLKQMKVTYSTEEDQKDPAAWEVSHCYRAVVFQKVLAQPNRYQFDRSTRDKYLLKYPVQLDFKLKKKNEE